MKNLLKSFVVLFSTLSLVHSSELHLNSHSKSVTPFEHKRSIVYKKLEKIKTLKELKTKENDSNKIDWGQRVEIKAQEETLLLKISEHTFEVVFNRDHILINDKKYTKDQVINKEFIKDLETRKNTSINFTHLLIGDTYAGIITITILASVAAFIAGLAVNFYQFFTEVSQSDCYEEFTEDYNNLEKFEKTCRDAMNDDLSGKTTTATKDMYKEVKTIKMEKFYDIVSDIYGTHSGECKKNLRKNYTFEDEDGDEQTCVFNKFKDKNFIKINGNDYCQKVTKSLKCLDHFKNRNEIIQKNRETLKDYKPRKIINKALPRNNAISR